MTWIGTDDSEVLGGLWARVAGVPVATGEYEARMEHVLAKYIDFAAWLQVTCDEFNRRIGLD